MASDARVELGLLSLLGEIGTELLEGGGLAAARGAGGAGGRADSLLGLADHADHLGSDLGGIGVKVLEHTGGDALTLAKKTEEKVLGANVVVTQLASLLKGELEDALGAGSEGDLHSHETTAATDDLLDLDARLLQADAW